MTSSLGHSSFNKNNFMSKLSKTWTQNSKLIAYLIWANWMTHSVCLAVIKLAYIPFGITSAIIMRNVLNSHLLIQCIRSTQHWLCSVMHHIRWTWQQDGRENVWAVYKVHICDSMCACKCIVAYSWFLCKCALTCPCTLYCVFTYTAVVLLPGLSFPFRK